MKQETYVPYNLRLPAKLKAKLEKQAKEEKRSLNSQIIRILETVQQQQAKQGQAASA